MGDPCESQHLGALLEHEVRQGVEGPMKKVSIHWTRIPTVPRLQECLSIPALAQAIYTE